MTGPKPLPEGCTGGIFCPVAGHVKTRANGSTRRTVFSHIHLTVGQRKQLHERRVAATTTPRETP